MPSSASFTPLRRARWLWLAVLLAVFGATMPTIGRALAAGAAGAGMEVCTSTGMAWVSAHGAGDDASGAEAFAQGMECPWCLLTANPALPGPDTVGVLAPMPLAYRVPVARLPFFRLAFAALAPPSRGPPAFS